MPTLQDVAGDTGVFTDGNWILSENMDANGKYGVIQLKHVGIGEFLGYKDFNFINEKTFNDLRCTEVLPGDVLISRMADPIGRACIVPQLPFPCVTAVDVTIVRIDKNIAEPEFIMHLCNSPSMREKIDRAVRGTTRARITRTELGELEIPLPPLTEQKRIASLLARADRLRQLRRKARELADSLLQSVFLEMFGDPRTNPKGWQVEKVGKHIKNIRYGTGSPPDYFEKGIPFIRATNVKQGTIKPQGMVYISEEDAKNISKCQIKAGDLIVVRSGINSGDCALIPPEYDGAYAAYDLIVEVPFPTNHFLNTVINSPFGKETIATLSRRAGQPHVNSEQIESMEYPFPPLSLQEEFARVVARVEAMRARQAEAERQAEALFQSLLAEAFG